VESVAAYVRRADAPITRRAVGQVIPVASRTTAPLEVELTHDA
jgi:hypothetical protein